MIVLRRDHATLLPSLPGTVLAGLHHAPAAARRTLDIALEAGVCFVDAGHVQQPAEAMHGIASALQGRGEAVLVMGTVPSQPHGPAAAGRSVARHLQAQVDTLLQRLGRPYLDVLVLQGWQAASVPMETLVLAVDALMRAGRIRYWGVSGFAAWQLASAVHAARALRMHTPVLQQVRYTPLARLAECELLPAGHQLGVAAVVMSPACRAPAWMPSPSPALRAQRQALGWLQPLAADEDTAWEAIHVLEGIATARGVSASQVAMAWLRGAAGVSTVAACMADEVELVASLSVPLQLAAHERARIDALLPAAAVLARITPRFPDEGMP